MVERDREFLAQLQAMSLNDKFQRTLGLVGEWHNYYHDNVYVSCSGGKDSTVLADIDAKWCKMINQPLNLAFSNTGLEYPEIQRHVRELKPYFEDKYDIEVNLTVVRPKMQFSEVISKYGYPLIGKEVAEAIYYARRIRSQSSNGERERDAGRHGGDESSFAAKDYRAITPEHKKSKSGAGTEENGTRRHTINRRESQPTAQSRGSWNTYESKQRDRWVLSGFRSAAGVEPFKSQFNKERWLPLARDVPFMISHYCCNVMKKSPLAKFQKQTGMYPFLGTMAEESRLRTQAWIRHGCNAFEGSKHTSQPLSFWTEQDILAYTLKSELPLASVYGEIVAVDGNGLEFDPSSLIGDCGKLKCTGCQRTGQIKAAA